MERRFGMARHAIRSELPMMGIGMAVAADGMLNPGKLLEFDIICHGHRMAFLAGNCLVNTCELKFCVCVVELRSGLEGIGYVTVEAWRGKSFLVVVGMTGYAVRTQAEIGEFLGPDLRIGDEGNLMAVFARFLCVSPIQGETCESMIEFILVEPDDLKIQAMVITMAGSAILAFYLR